MRHAKHVIVILVALCGFLFTTSLLAQEIEPRLNIDLTKIDGTKIRMAEHFVTQYLVVDFSQLACGACREASEQMNSNQDFQSLFQSKKCNMITLVPEGQVRRWVNWIGGATSFVGQHSYSVTGSLTNVAEQAFNYKLPETPSFIIIDRQGQILAKPVWLPGSDAEEFCQ